MAAAGLVLARGAPLSTLSMRYPTLTLLTAFGVATALVLAGYVYFNIVHPTAAYQPQGRYLFGALVPIFTFLALGLREVLRRVARLAGARLEGGLVWLCAGSAGLMNLWCLAVVASATWPRVTWSP